MNSRKLFMMTRMAAALLTAGCALVGCQEGTRHPPGHESHPLATADSRPLTPQARIAARTFPSVFQAWNPADNLKGEDPWTTLARHDLIFHDPRFFGLRWNHEFIGLATGFAKESVPVALKRRAELLQGNPNLVLLAEIRYRDAASSFLPQDHPWWKRRDGAVVAGWEEGGYLQLDFANPAFRHHVAQQAQAAVASGVFDGVMLDWWTDDADRLALIQEIRAAMGQDALILANANDRTTPRTAPYLNGYFMECTQSKTPEDWNRIAETLRWAEVHLKAPHINCLETWFHRSRGDLNLMRATTTLSLTLSDGYCLFSDPNPLPTPDHLHDWYEFWNKSLGRPTGKGMEQPDGSFRRAFERGTAIYNPLSNPSVTVRFPQACLRASDCQTATSFTVAPGDGDLFFVP